MSEHEAEVFSEAEQEFFRAGEDPEALERVAARGDELSKQPVPLWRRIIPRRR